VAAITRAHADLERAVSELDKLPAVDAASLGLAAHALNNFLTVSFAVVEFLIEALRTHEDPQVPAGLEALAHANVLMGHAVGLLMSNAARTPLALRVDELDVSRLVSRATRYYLRSAAPKGVQLTFSAESEVPRVRTDAVILAAILDNLLSNAVKHSPAGGRVRVEVTRTGDGVSCHVRDEGPGLSEAEQARLFLPGARLGAVSTGGEPSPGYGLAIAKRFTDLLGGRLTCSSVTGQGATFTLTLPRERAPEARPD
jgi:signal transduction histidine kinase